MKQIFQTYREQKYWQLPKSESLYISFQKTIYIKIKNKQNHKNPMSSAESEEREYHKLQNYL